MDAHVARYAPRWLVVLQAIFGRRWNFSESCLPDYDGWYRVMVSGDSESIDGHQVYAFDDYETWARFVTDEDGGQFTGIHDEETDMIFAWCGPFVSPRFKDTPYHE